MNTKRENIIFITEFILNCITATAMIFMLISIVAMIETWNASGTPLVVFVICLAWLGTISAYKKLVNR